MGNLRTKKNWITTKNEKQKRIIFENAVFKYKYTTSNLEIFK